MKRFGWGETGLVIAAVLGMVAMTFGEEGTMVPVDSPWTIRLSADGGGLWAKRIAVTIRNGSNAALKNRFVSIPIVESSISSSPGKSIALAGLPAESIRVTNDKGREFLFELTDAENLPFHSGPLPAGGNLVLPVSAAAGEEAVFFVWFDNPAAWRLPDWPTVAGRVINPDFEQGEGQPPRVTGWQFDQTDSSHRLTWSEEKPASGKHSVQTVVDSGAKPTWIAARHPSVYLESGADYEFTAQVRAENVTGTCGWYLHYGDAEKEMISCAMADGGSGTFDWKTVSVRFSAKEGIDRVTFGTVLRGTGSAWFDNVTLKKIGDDSQSILSIRVGAIENDPIADHFPDGFNPEKPESFDPSRFDLAKESRMAMIRVRNDGPARRSVVVLPLESIARRMNREFSPDNFLLLDDRGRQIPVIKWNDAIFFVTELAALSRNYFLVVEKANSTSRRLSSDTKPEDANEIRTAFPGTSIQAGDDAKATTGKSDADFTVPSFFQGLNLVANADFEKKNDAGEVENWTPQGKGEKVTLHSVDPKKPGFGRSALEMVVPDEAAGDWRGWTQQIPVEAGKRYFCAYSLSTDSSGGDYRLHVHQRKKDGSLSSGGMSSYGQPVSGRTDWTIKSDIIMAALDTDFIQLHLTNPGAGTVRWDNLLLVEVTDAEVFRFLGGRNGVYQVPAVVKVFPETTFGADAKEITSERTAFLTAARNEVETLQFAIRPKTTGIWRVKQGNIRRVDSSPSESASDAALPTPEVYAVGLVPVDYPTNYYNIPGKETFERKLPRSGAGCDGWAGWWPDPLIPIAPSVDAMADVPTADKSGWRNDSARLAAMGKAGLLPLEAGKTRAVWLSFHVPAKTAPGFYAGELRLESLNGETETILPWRLRVFDVELSTESPYGAIYDLRSAEKFAREGESTRDTQKRLIEFMAQRRLSPDTLPVTPNIVYDKSTGEATCDWTEFDAAAEWYFDRLGIPFSYTPNGLFYLFGWGLPPKEIEGEKPYEGDYPYEKADHLVLRSEFKKVYQAQLRLLWNHLKERGWNHHFVLYISDEPFYSQTEIIAQMKAICEMIHEVDPAIPIYSSTWRHIPEWDGALNVWGIGHYGIVSPEQLEKSRKRGDRFWWTTDGQMCLDTPYCAVERLLPWWCHRWGADAYEFWGATWFTYDPFDYGWHRYIPQSDTPTNQYFVRYPNGDGYIFYPGKNIGLDEIISSVRAEAARDGQEDAVVLRLLKTELDKRSDSKFDGDATVQKARSLYDEAMSFVPIPVAGGRYSTRFLKNPDRIEPLRAEIGEVLEKWSQDRPTPR